CVSHSQYCSGIFCSLIYNSLDVW
nr:immunoglobulin heavy chain junction region [Macaca mulatta]